MSLASIRVASERSKSNRDEDSSAAVGYVDPRWLGAGLLGGLWVYGAMWWLGELVWLCVLSPEVSREEFPWK